MFVLAVASAALLGCAHEESSVVAPVSVENGQGTQGKGGGARREPRDFSAVFIRMERKACYGICPSYTVDITGDGQVTYVGRDFVGTRGQKKGTADSVQIGRLLDEAERIHLATLVDSPRCANVDTEQATVVLTVRDRGNTIKLTHQLGNGCYPSDLVDFEAMVDQVSGSGTWTRCETGPCLF